MFHYNKTCLMCMQNIKSHKIYIIMAKPFCFVWQLNSSCMNKQKGCFNYIFYSQQPQNYYITIFHKYYYFHILQNFIEVDTHDAIILFIK